MDLLIFGASGGTGRELVNQALEKGHRVTAFVRNPSRLHINHDHIRIIQGDVKHYESVYDSVQPGQVVLVALGPDSPFKRDMTLISGMRHIVKAMEVRGAHRIVYLSFAGVKDARQHLGLPFRYFVVPLLTCVVKDHEEKEKIIQESSLKWTIARPAMLTNGPHTGRFKPLLTGSPKFASQQSTTPKPGFRKLMISRADVADFMLSQLTDQTYVRKSVLLTH